MNSNSSPKVLESYARLKLVIGENQALELITFLQAQNEERQEQMDKNMASQLDLKNLELSILAQIKDSRLEMVTAIKDLKIEMVTAIKDLKNDKADVIKWSFIFWIGQIVALYVILHH